jgi:hypothetical protein
MLLVNKLRLFDKKGNSLSPTESKSIVVTVVDPGDIKGNGALINAYTDIAGRIIYVEILAGGQGYNPGTYLKFEDAQSGATWTTDPIDLTLSISGVITSFNVTYPIENSGFSYTSSFLFTNQFLEPVSTGLVATDQLFIVENVFDANGNEAYCFPRSDEYGPFDIQSYSANGTSATVKISTISASGNVLQNKPSVIWGIPPATISLIEVGMFVVGTGISDIAFVSSIDTTYNTVTISQSLPTGSVNIEFFKPHNLRVGNTIRIFDTLGSSSLDGRHELVKVSPTELVFESSQILPPTLTSTMRFGVIPLFRISLDPSSDEEFFLFDVVYNEDYPTIEKFREQFFEVDDPQEGTPVDTFPTGNGTYQRTVYQRIYQNALAFNIGLRADYEGVYAAQINLDDVTYPTPVRVFFGLYEGETVAEDERLGLLLQNFGRDVDFEQELILRDSDVNEDLPDNVLLNAKRKEMLLEGNNIWPYVGSYKGLVNMLNWFGYYDIRVKEYFLNVNEDDEYFGKYRQVQIPFQLKDKGNTKQEVNLVPSKHYKKTSRFGLFYDLIKDSGEFDSFGMPLTQDAFEYTNEEVLIKLFALKRYLKEKFLPLNSRIVDITGEGVYYDRYSVNSWNDPSNYFNVDLTRQIDFDADKKTIEVESTIPFDPDETLPSPPYFDLLGEYTNKYNINNALVATPGGPYWGQIPQVSFPGQAYQQASGYTKMRAYSLGIIAPLTPSGVGYQPGDVITLSGGVYEVPIRITVNTVGPNGEVTNFAIQSGLHQGSNYSSLPTSGFSQASVSRISGTQYVAASAQGFNCLSTDIPFELESIGFTTKGIKYSNIPTVDILPNIGSAINLDLITVNNSPVGYLNDNAPIFGFINVAGSPVGAPLDLKTAFDITWDEVPYTWNSLGGGSDAVLKGYVSELPSGSGQLLAVEIVSPGNVYRYAPTFVVGGGDGTGGEVCGLSAPAELRNGQLKILNFTVTAVAGNVLDLSPLLPATGSNVVSPNRIIKGPGIPEGTIVSAVNQPFSQVILTKFDGSPVVITTVAGDEIEIHEGVSVTNPGSGYTSAPTISPKGGHVGNLYTWDELGRGDFYQMEWKVTLTAPENPIHQFNYFSGIKPIDDLINHQLILPYVGKYTVEMIAYDTDNNFINEIKNNFIEVVLPDATYAYVARYIEGCVDTWDEYYQPPIPEFEPNPVDLQPVLPEGIRYNWENAFGRWVNPAFTLTTWDSARVRWDSLETGNLNRVNEYNYPIKVPVDVIQVSPEDNVEGPVISYTDSTTTPSTLNPTIVVSGQRAYPEIEPAINPNDWIFIRRDGVTYQLEVLNANYGTPGQTEIELTAIPPSAFTNSPTTWQVLREVGGTVVLAGDQIYNAVTNPNGIVIGDYIRLFGADDIPKRYRTQIIGKDTLPLAGQPNNITLNGGGTDSIYYDGGELGMIYQYRGDNLVNGNLIWDSTPANSTWVIKGSPINDPLIYDHIGKLYILSATPALGLPGCLPADPTAEITPGFSVITIYVQDPLLGRIYEQRLRTTHVFFDTSNTGHPFDIWGGLPAGYTGVHVIDFVALDGGDIDGLTSQLATWQSGGASIWIEYEYNEFPTRTYLGQNSGGNAEIYMDFNMYPSSGDFNNALAPEFAVTTAGTGWYYDHGIASGDYSLLVTNTGYWRNTTNTIITVDDIESELLRSSSSFQVMQRKFDEDFAETKIGTLVQQWKNYRTVTWDESCYHTWDTVDFQERIACDFIITGVDQNGSIQFNNDITFFFQGIIGGMSNGEKWSQALYELRATDNTALSRFEYELLGEENVDKERFFGYLNTYDYPDLIIDANGAGPAPIPFDVVVSEFTGPAAEIQVYPFVGATPNDIQMVNPLPKKLNFVGNVKNGSAVISKITGLNENEIYVGEIITGPGLPVSPALPARVVEIASFQGSVISLTLDTASTLTQVNSSFDVEWYSDELVDFTLVFQNAANLKIHAVASTPSTDHLGWLIGQNGVTFEDPLNLVNTPICHSYPLKNVTKQFGYGVGLVGAFEGGLKEFLMTSRYYQIYQYEGLNPLALPGGWYPAADLPPQYSFTMNPTPPALPVWDNDLIAEAQSNRLPYESAIGGTWRWEDTYIGIEPVKLPSGSTVYFSSDASRIAGKSGFYWKLSDDTKTLVELTDPAIMWTFDRPGKFTIELEITDSNGNKKNYTRKDFLTIYENT